uniref:Uncharacterized protein n=1 Tax=Ascaris lumbricoides TaxID=6252 RepID=A0A0M3ISR2_ASCLU
MMTFIWSKYLHITTQLSIAIANKSYDKYICTKCYYNLCNKNLYPFVHLNCVVAEKIPQKSIRLLKLQLHYFISYFE